MTAVTTDSRARDITFTFEDSCNCCCFKWRVRGRPSENTPVFVQDYGVVERYNPRKTQNEIVAIKRSISNLQKRLEYVSQVHQRHYPQIMDQIETDLGENLSEDRQEPLTYGYIERINELLKKIFASNNEDT